jgi:hypothetical protein
MFKLNPLTHSWKQPATVSTTVSEICRYLPQGIIAALLGSKYFGWFSTSTGLGMASCSTIACFFAYRVISNMELNPYDVHVQYLTSNLSSEEKKVPLSLGKAGAAALAGSLQIAVIFLSPCLVKLVKPNVDFSMLLRYTAARQIASIVTGPVLLTGAAVIVNGVKGVNMFRQRTGGDA